MAYNVQFLKKILIKLRKSHVVFIQFSAEVAVVLDAIPHVIMYLERKTENLILWEHLVFLFILNCVLFAYL